MRQWFVFLKKVINRFKILRVGLLILVTAVMDAAIAWFRLFYGWPQGIRVIGVELRAK
jgi:hypothetical protein